MYVVVNNRRNVAVPPPRRQSRRGPAPSRGSLRSRVSCTDLWLKPGTYFGTRALVLWSAISLVGCAVGKDVACASRCIPVRDFHELVLAAGEPGGPGVVDGPSE